MRASRRWLLLGIPLALVAAYGYYAASQLGLLTASKDLRQEVDRLRKAGAPMNSDELNVRAKADADPSATSKYVEAAAHFDYRTNPWLNDLRLLPRERERPDEIPNFKKSWARLAHARKLIEEASRADRANLRRDFDFYADNSFQYLHWVEEGYRTSAEVKAREGDISGALDELATSARIARHWLQDPSPAAYRIGAVSEMWCLQLLARIVALKPDDPEVLRQAKAILDTFEIPNVKWMIAGDIAQARDWVLVMSNPEFAKGLKTNLGRFRSGRDAMLARYYRPLRQAYETLPDDPVSVQQQLEILRKVPVQQDRLSKEFLGEDPFPSDLITYLTFLDANRKVSRLALDLCRLRNEGALPKAAGNSGIWLNPITRKPFPLVRTTDGFSVYGFGMNLKDDGGTPGYSSRPGDDLVWRIPDRSLVTGKVP